MRTTPGVVLVGMIAAGGMVGIGLLSADRAVARELPAAAATRPLDQGPQVRPASEAGIGRLISLAGARDLRGKAAPRAALRGPQGLVVALLSSSCPVSKRLAPALGRQEAAYSRRGVSFVYVAPIAADTGDSLRDLARTAGLRGPILRDETHRLCADLGVTSTTEVLLADGARTLVYRGAVSDQYGPTWSLEQARRNYLADAIEALLAGTAPSVAATTAPGCTLSPRVAGRTAAPPGRGAPTYHARISRIVQAHCGECHRKGGLAPFALETLPDVTAHAAMIERVVEQGRMPPWFAAPPPPGKPSLWANDRTLPAADRADLLAWLRGPRPAGSPDDAPLPRRFDPSWLAGKPDVTFQIPEPVAVQADGTMAYVSREVETGFTEDRWVRAIEVAPTDRSVVHHVLVFVRAPGTGGRVNELRDELSGFFGIYVPGNSTLVYPPGFAKKIPAGSRLRFQIHYTPNGKATTDQTRLGLQFTSGPPEHEVRVAGIANLRLAIPAGAPDHPEQAALPVPAEAKLLGFLPHMHLRGKAARFEVVAADGTRRVLLDVPRYDFNWQLYYRLAEPVTVHPGSRIEFTGRFDNSAGNPANPDPGKLVRWGAQTYDEMLLGYVEYYTEGNAGPALRPGLGLRPAGGLGEGQGLEALFRRFDRDGNGKITAAELPNAALFRRLDADGDGAVTLEETRTRLPGLRRDP